MVSHWSLSDSNSAQVSRTLLSVLADLNNAVVWMFSTRPLISKSSSPCINLLVTVPRVPVRIGITVTFTFHSFFNTLTFFFFFFAFFQFTLRSAGIAKSTVQQVLFFFLIITRSGYLAEVRGPVSILKSQRSLCVSVSRTDSGLCIYHLFVWSNFNFYTISSDYLAHTVVSSLILFLC